MAPNPPRPRRPRNYCERLYATLEREGEVTEDELLDLALWIATSGEETRKAYCEAFRQQVDAYTRWEKPKALIERREKMLALLEVRRG